MNVRRFSPRSVCALLTTAGLLGSLLFPSVASAQDTDNPLQQGGFDLRLFRPAVDSKGVVTVNGTDILGSRAFSFGLILDLGRGLAPVARDSQALVENMFSGVFHANLGIGNVLVVGFQLPFHLTTGPANTPSDTMAGTSTLGVGLGQYNTGPGGLNYQGLGDIVLHAKLRWLRGEYYPVGLAVNLQVGIPLMGGPRNFAGEPGPWVWPAVAVERRFGRRFRLAGNLGFRMPFGDAATLTPAGQDASQSVTYGPSITWGVGASFRAVSVLDLMVEAYGAQYVNGFSNFGPTTPIEAVGGVKIFVDRNSYLMIGAGRGLTSGWASSSFRGFIGFIFEPTVGDTDGDGYRDDVDRCVFEPEDFDNFEDEEGCPEPDNDRDGILDVDDQCPLVPEDRNGQQDSDGCPDSEVQDRDGDQIADNVDRCPDDPEDRDNFEDDNGCPEPDNDQDQILDTDDLCPNDPEDRDGFEDDNGCPDPDNDRDGILDEADHSAEGTDCRNDPETQNGLDDQDGCPDNGLLTFTGTEIRTPQINFETDSAQIVDNDLNRNILEQFSTALRNRPDLELIEIEGHTDERAPDDHNLQLSRDRANSVMQALIARGLAPNRLVAAGYGEYCPIDPRSNEEAWARNRRVQFLIIRTSVDGRTTREAGCPRGRQYVPATVGPPARGTN